MPHSINDSTPSGYRGNASLPRKIREMTDGGASWEALGYPHRFAARKAVLHAMKAAGWSFDDAYRYILANPSRPVYDLWASSKAEIGHSGRLALLVKDWEQVTRFYDQHARDRLGRPDVMALCGELRALAAVYPWPQGAPRTWRNVRAVTLLAIEYAQDTAWLEVKLPVREVAKRLAMGDHMTAHRAIVKARDLGWLLSTDYEPPWDKGKRYRVNTGMLDSSHNTTNFSINTDGDQTPTHTYSESASSVVIVQQILGKELGALIEDARVTVLVALHNAQEPLTKAELARRSGVSPSTVTRAIAQFRREGLAQSADGKHWAPGPKGLDHDPGTGIAATRAARIERQRAAYRDEHTEYLEMLHGKPQVMQGSSGQQDNAGQTE